MRYGTPYRSAGALLVPKGSGFLGRYSNLERKYILQIRHQKIALTDHFTLPRLLLFVLPSILTMVVTSIYGVVDGFFISNLAGKTAFAAANITWPLLMIFSGVGFLFGTGGSALVAAALGEGNKKRAHALFSEFAFTLLLLTIALTIAAEITLPQAVVWLGADETMLPDCIAYGRFLLLGIVPFAFQNFFTPFMVTAGKPGLGTFFTVLAGLTNMAGDAILMGAFGAGVAGAALATTLSACAGSVLPLLYFLLPNKSTLRLGRFRYDFTALGKAASNGSSELISNLSLAFVNVLYNVLLMKYMGEDGVAAFGVISYVNCIFTAVFSGYAIGMAPIVSAHMGMGDFKEVRSILKKSLFLLLAFGCGMAGGAAALSPALAALFTGYDQALCTLTTHAFRIFAISFLFMGYNIFTSSFFTALGNGGVSFLVSFLRTFVLQAACAMLLPLAFGAEGIWWATALAEAICLCISLFFLTRERMHLKTGTGKKRVPRTRTSFQESRESE